MKKQNSIFFLLLAVVTVCSISFNSKKEIVVKEFASDSLSKIPLDKKLEWFHEAKYGLFIHWGLYALPAGE